MSPIDIDVVHPLATEGAIHRMKEPELRADKQGDRPDAQRVELAMRNFVNDFGRTSAIYMESCIHCGMCAQACHFCLVGGIRGCFFSTEQVFQLS